LNKLQHKAFLQSEDEHDDSFERAWIENSIAKSPTLHFWDTILRMEILGLVFVRAHRQKKLFFIC